MERNIKASSNFLRDIPLDSNTFFCLYNYCNEWYTYLIFMISHMHIYSVNMTEILSLDTSVHLELHYYKGQQYRSSQYNIKKATTKNLARNQHKFEYAYWNNASATIFQMSWIC